MTTTAILSLHDIGEAQDILDTLIAEHDSEVTPEIDALWEQLKGQRDEKVERWGLWLRGTTLQAELIKAEEIRLAARRKALENAVERGKAALQFHMERLGVEKVKGKLITVAIQTNNPAVKGNLSQEALEIVYADWSDIVKLIPASFALDRTAALTAHKAGHQLPAGLTVEQSTSIRIR